MNKSLELKCRSHATAGLDHHVRQCFLRYRVVRVYVEKLDGGQLGRRTARHDLASSLLDSTLFRQQSLQRNKTNKFGVIRILRL